MAFYKEPGITASTQVDFGKPARMAAQACAHAAELGEGPLWAADQERVYWVDIKGQRLNTLNPDGSIESFQMDEAVCAVARAGEDQLLVALAKRIVLTDLRGQIRSTIIELESHLTDNRCNDGKVDPAGRFWVGTMNQQAQPGGGSLYRLDASGKLERILSGLTIPNGLAWSGDHKTMYYIDSPTSEVWAFDFDPGDSSIRNHRTVIKIHPDMGIPDGMAIDSKDRLWIAHWGDGMVRCWNPADGSHLESISIGSALSTSCCFGGWNLDELYITSAKGEGSAGLLYRIKTDASGVSGCTFGNARD